MFSRMQKTFSDEFTASAPRKASVNIPDAQEFISSVTQDDPEQTQESDDMEVLGALIEACIC